MAEFSFDVFLSYNRADRLRVLRLAERLKVAGVRVWLDEWVIRAGDIIALKVDEGLEQSRVLLLCLSPAALNSDWVKLERGTVIHRDPSNQARRFVPLLLEESAIPDTISRYKYLDYREESDAAFAEVLAVCLAGRDAEPPVVPEDRCWPFIPIDEEFSLFHVPGARDPFPTRQEYLDGKVPALEADAEVSARLEAYGWACCIDVASVGKTTLALRVATAHQQRDHPVYYFDLKIGVETFARESPHSALHHLARAGTLLILDNINYQPELARQLWQQWTGKPAESRGRLLLIGTRVHQPVVVSPEQDLRFFEVHRSNPAILLKPSPEDLGRLAKHLYYRIGGARCPAFQEPPAEVLATWHSVYRAALNAFTFAVLESLAEFQAGSWSLPPSRASAWVRKHWLDRLDEAEIDNVACLAAFGAQDLEMTIFDAALPHPGKVQKLFEFGLISEGKTGILQRDRYLELRESGWGELILAALHPQVKPQQILLAASARHLLTAAGLAARFRVRKDVPRLQALCQVLSDNANDFDRLVRDLPLHAFLILTQLANEGYRPDLVARLWEALESQPENFAARAWATPLENLGNFFKMARNYGRDVTPLWNQIDDTEKLFARAWEIPLDHIASLVDVARLHGRDTTPMWELLERQPGRLADRALESSLERVSYFIQVARRHGRDTDQLWQLLERQPDKVIARAWETPLDSVGTFFEIARAQGRDTAPLWELFERQSDKLIARLWETPLDKMGSFLDIAAQQGRTIEHLWESLERQPEKLLARTWETSLVGITYFFKIATQHGRNTGQLWELLERQPAKLIARAWENPLGSLGSFLENARLLGRNTAALWELLERRSDELIARFWEARLDEMGSFLEIARLHGRDTTELWRSLEREPAKLVAHAWSAPLDAVGSFLEVAIRHGRDTAPIWALLEKDHEAFVSAAWASPPHKLGSFLNVAKRQQRDVTRFWQLLERNENRFVASAWSASLDSVGSFLDVAKLHGRDALRFWGILASAPDRLGQKGKNAPMGSLALFSGFAPPSVLAIALHGIEPGQWRGIPIAKSMAHAAWLARNILKAGRTDLGADLLTLLLQRASRRDFQPRFGGFDQLCVLLANVPAEASGLVDPFLEAVCSDEWLNFAYAISEIGYLANGLRLVALHQTLDRCRRFHHPSLGARLKRELAGFDSPPVSERSKVIQLLGCAGLCGWAVSHRNLAPIAPASIAELVGDLTSHQPDATRIEEAVFQLWLGLRAFVSIRWQNLPLPRAIIEETYRLWTANCQESSIAPTTSAHRVNQSMLAWLESCLNTEPPALIPTREPLWTLVGFPSQLAVPDPTPVEDLQSLDFIFDAAMARPD